MKQNPAVLSQLRYDEASTTIAYIGEASPGVSSSTAAWRIKRLDTTAGVHITWANGTSQFDKIWDNRASYSYS